MAIPERRALTPDYVSGLVGGMALALPLYLLLDRLVIPAFARLVARVGGR